MFQRTEVLTLHTEINMNKAIYRITKWHQYRLFRYERGHTKGSVQSFVCLLKQKCPHNLIQKSLLFNMLNVQKSI
jgi:hypothetical protein